MFNYIKSKIDWDKDLPERSKLIDLFLRVYNSQLYDHFKFYFFQERDMAGNYIPIDKRQPSVKANFCKLVVDDSVSLLFGSDHFPTVKSDSEDIRKELEEVIKQYNLQELMIQAATIGSSGSVCILVRVFDGILNFQAKNTKYLTVAFDVKNPTRINKLIERYKVKGKDLIDSGYTKAQIDKPDQLYWFHREWDSESETYFLPYLCNDSQIVPAVDPDRTTTHNLGFVPAVWIKNLPSTDTDSIDGACSFSISAIDTNIEIDYQLSQVGRALRYSGDPLLVLKIVDDLNLMTQNAQTDENGNRRIVRSSDNALVLSKDDEAKLLEISGESCKAVLEFVRTLREYLLECLHGNRSNADKVNAAQSGSAMKAMNQALIWLADKLRISYGEGGFLSLLKMIVQISNAPGNGIQVGEKRLMNLDKSATLSLQWPAWYPDTPADKVQSASAIKTLTDTSVISKETATKTVADDYHIEDIEQEQKLIEEDRQKIIALNPKITEIQTI